LYAAFTGFEIGLNKINKYVYDTLNELGMQVQEINLSLYDIHYYNGITVKSVNNIIDIINKSDGVIFSCTASLLSYNALMHTFLEYFNSYKDALKNKNCLVIVNSIDKSERIAGNSLCEVINILGGNDIYKICIGKKYIDRIDFDDNIKIMTEKYAEDFYRIIRQNRSFFSDYTDSVQDSKNNDSTSIKDNADYISKQQNNNYSQNLYDNLKQPKQKMTSDEFLRKEITDNFNEAQVNDIDEITKIISQQYNKNYKTGYGKQNNISNLYKENSAFKKTKNITPRISTCKQRTSSLIHHFQPQLAQSLTANIQINIVDGDNFACYLTIQDGECMYYDGICEYPDVTIFSHENVWSDILDGKYTSQKAFMVGKIKVKGNFILLSKFDQIFKTGV